MIVRDFRELSEYDYPWLDRVGKNVPYNNLTVPMILENCHVNLLDDWGSFETEPDMQAAFSRYQEERRLEVLRLQSAARNSLEWFEEGERYLDLGATGYLSKPLDLESVRRAVNGALEPVADKAEDRRAAG